MARRVSPVGIITGLGFAIIGLYLIYVVLTVLGIEIDALGLIMNMLVLAAAAFASEAVPGVIVREMTGEDTRFAIAGGLFLTGIVLLVCAGICALLGYAILAVCGAAGGLGLWGAAIVVARRAYKESSLGQPNR